MVSIADARAVRYSDSPTPSVSPLRECRFGQHRRDLGLVKAYVLWAAVRLECGITSRA